LKIKSYRFNQVLVPSNNLSDCYPAVPKATFCNGITFLKITIKKRAEVLGNITKDTFVFAVAGTHGKTTTSSILGHIYMNVR
jgi:UDP-N-acetylmuramate--alanine ligase